jgi:hypothetical protein
VLGQVGLDRARGDGVDGDAGRRQLYGHGSGQMHEAGLARAIGGAAFVAALARDRADVDDAAAALARHRAGGMLPEQEGARQVDPHHSLPLLDRDLQERPVEPDARIGDEAVDAPERVERCLGRALAIGRDGNIGDNGAACPPAARICATALVAPSASRSATVTAAPSRVAAVAMSRLMPRPAPFTSKTSSLRRSAVTSKLPDSAVEVTNRLLVEVDPDRLLLCELLKAGQALLAPDAAQFDTAKGDRDLGLPEGVDPDGARP